MAVNPVSSAAIQGIQRGFQGLRRAAADIANNVQQPDKTAGATDFNRSLVELQQHATRPSPPPKPSRRTTTLLAPCSISAPDIPIRRILSRRDSSDGGARDPTYSRSL